MGDKQSCVRVFEDHEKILHYTEKINELQPSFQRLAQVLDLAGNENRLKIIYLLRGDNDLCVCDLSDILNMTIPAVSQHLRKLKDAQLIQSKKVGQTVYYAVREDAQDILHLLLAHLTKLNIEPALVS